MSTHTPQTLADTSVSTAVNDTNENLTPELVRTAAGDFGTSPSRESNEGGRHLARTVTPPAARSTAMTATTPTTAATANAVAVAGVMPPVTA